ncbi:MAG TPA: ISNCY family transposase [Bacteroidetes bacterium]|nr:ISNCY family transposase [Bacteroidota bacterium]
MSGLCILGVPDCERAPAMTETVTMSSKEREHLKVISRIEAGELTVAEAAESIHLTERQMYRLLRRHRHEGDRGLIHRLRGRRSNLAYAAEVRTKAVRLYRELYSDYGPTLFAEKLEFYHDLKISRQTATRWLIEESLWSGSRKKRPHRKKRQRRDCIGSLIQFDGSEHDWFEGRAPKCTLLVSIDDASNRVMLRFTPTEDTLHVLSFWRDYVARFGIPGEVYTDRDSVYYDNNNTKHLTAFGLAMTRLGVHLIHAHSPQAKGRVERSNRTHQDRLIKYLREQNVSSIDDANQLLERFFTDDHNRRFAHTDGLTDIHRPARGLDLNNIFCLQETRQVHNDWTVSLNTRFIQLQRSDAPLPPPRSNVMLRRWLDGSLHIFWNEHQLKFTILPPHTRPKLPPHRPSTLHHPWRSKPAGGLRTQRRRADALDFYRKRMYNNAPIPTTKTPKPKKPSLTTSTKNNASP